MALSGGAAVAGPDDGEPLMKLLADKGFLAAAPPAPAPAGRDRCGRRARRRAGRAGPDPPRARPGRRHGGLGDELHRRALPPRRHLGRDRLRLQRLHPPRLRDEPRPGAAAPRRRAGGDARPGQGRAQRAEARRPGVLQHHAPHLLARRHLHRRQPLRPRAAATATRCASTTCASPTGPSASPARAAPSCRRAPRPPSPTRPNRPRTERRSGSPLGRPAPAQRHNRRMAERVIPLADHRYARDRARDPGRASSRPPACVARPPAAGRCTTCASRSPTAATSAAATACRRRSSTSTTPSCRTRRC